FVYAVPEVSKSLDPVVFQGDASRWTQWDQLSSLVVYDTAKIKGNGCDQLAGANDLKGELAESWKLKDDKSGYSVTLRAAKSPAGNTVSSNDVLWSYQRDKALSGVSQYMYTGQAKYADDAIKVIDDRHFDLVVKQTGANDIQLQTIGPFTLGIYDST